MTVAAAEAPRARIHLTGAGGWGILTCLAVAAAAANTANNLLYLMLGLLLAAYAVSAWASRRTMLRLAGELIAPAEVRRGEAADVVATVAASQRRAAAVVLEMQVLDEQGRPARAPGHEAPPCRALPAVEPGAPATVSLPATFARRGPARLRLLARSPFPFGLVESYRRLADEEVLVLPQPDPSWRVRPSAARAEGEARPRKGEGTEIFNIRDYAWGEDARRMDWKATARLGRPMLREHAHEQHRSVVILIPALPPDEEAAERAISRAAGAAEELGRDGWRLRLVAPGAEAHGDARTILRALARLKLGSAPPDGWWRARLQPGDEVLRLSVEDP